MVRKHLLLLVLVFGLVACDAVEVELPITPPIDEKATLQSQITKYAEEVVDIQTAVVAEATELEQVIRTASAETTQISVENEELLRYVRQGQPPTSAVIISNEGVAFSGTAAIEFLATGMNFVNLSMASSVRDSDGCASVVQTIFPQSSPRIYFTGLAQNLQRGARIRVEWLFEGQQVTFTEWIPEVDEPSLCVWFFIDPNDVAFNVGRWSAILRVNDNIIGSPLEFSIASN